MKDLNLKKQLKNGWIAFLSILVTIQYSLILLYKGKTSKRADQDKCISLWKSKLLDIVKVSVRTHNPHQVSLKPGETYILMSNHTSLYDIPLIFETFPHNSIRMIAKKELFKVPIWGKAMEVSEFLMIDRQSSAQAIRTLEKAREKMQSGIVLWIAPEGTRSKDGKLGLFKKGGFVLAIQTRATIIPVIIKGANDILPSKSLNFNTHKTVDIYIGKPISTEGYTIGSRNELLHVVKEQMHEMQKNENAV